MVNSDVTKYIRPLYNQNNNFNKFPEKTVMRYIFLYCCLLQKVYFDYYFVKPPIPRLKIITRIPSPRGFPLRVRTSEVLPTVCILGWTCNIKMWQHRIQEIKLFPSHKNQPMEGFPQNLRHLWFWELIIEWVFYLNIFYC